jgi:hypothetical protein
MGAFVDNTFGRIRMFERLSQFIRGEISVEDFERSGRTDERLEVVNKLLYENGRKNRFADGCHVRSVV